MSVPTPTADPLPYIRHDAQPGGTQPGMTAPPSGQAIARFDALLHEINPDAVRVDPDRLQYLMQWLMTLSPEAAHNVLDRRLRRIEELRVMLDDSDWDTDDATRARLVKLFEYIDRDDDLIADHEPMIGLLDDVLLIELAWPVFAEEADEYGDFRDWRNDEHPTGSGGEQRLAWIRDRKAEIALWQHQLRVSESRYAPTGRPEGLFRVD